MRKLTDEETIEKLKEANRILDGVIELLDELFEKHKKASGDV